MSIVAALAVLPAGCSKGPGDIVDVSGRVTINGNPVEKVGVVFQPIKTDGNNNPGTGSWGVTDKDGRYTLKLQSKDQKAGAVVGKHKVMFENYKEPDDPSDDRPNKIRPKPAVAIPPDFYFHPKFEFDVPSSGTDKADFDLKIP
jgi:hypothetical protein